MASFQHNVQFSLKNNLILAVELIYVHRMLISWLRISLTPVMFILLIAVSVLDSFLNFCVLLLYVLQDADQQLILCDC